MKSRVSVLPWGDGTLWVVHLDGRPVGRSVDLERAIELSRWLETAIGDLDEWARPRCVLKVPYPTVAAWETMVWTYPRAS